MTGGVETGSAAARVVVYGADAGGAAVVQLAVVCGWTIVRFVADDPGARELAVADLPVEPAGTLARRDFDLVVVSPSLDRAAASEFLEAMGLTRGVSYVFGDEPVAVDGFEVRLQIAPVLRSGLRVVLFGTGRAAEIAQPLAGWRAWRIEYCVDNDATRWGRRFGDREIRSPRALLARDFDLVVVCSLPGRQAIEHQLAAMGLERGVDFVDLSEL
jgi:hypothetical protein